MTPEGRVKQKVKEILGEYPGLYYYMPVQTGFGQTSLDFIGCYAGRFFAVETKREGKKPTLKQLETIERMQTAGAQTFVIVGEDDVALASLSLWLEALRPSHDSARVPPPPRPRSAV